MSKKVEYIVVRDSFWAGVIGDVVMYGILLGMYAVNYKYLGNNGVLNVLFTILAVTFITNLFGSRFKHTFYSPEEAIKYLTEVSELVATDSQSQIEPLKSAINPPSDPKRKANT